MGGAFRAIKAECPISIACRAKVNTLIAMPGDIIVRSMQGRRPYTPALRSDREISKLMTQTTSRLFDELAKLMTDATGAAQGLRGEMDNLIRSQAEKVLRDLDVVQREEFDAMKAMAVKAREENASLEKRIAELEGELLRFGKSGEPSKQ
jgi:BMFP domain-containing protein YqiC